MKRNTTNWMLLIGALLLGGFILLVERDKENSIEKQQRARTLFAVYPESIDYLETERNGVVIACVKEGETWRLTKPADAPVNEAIVEKMIAGMAGVERGRLLSADTLDDRALTPADYGFDDPRARITFKNSRGTFTWLVGRDAPLGDEIYVMAKDSSDIIRAPRTLLNLVPEDPAWIRDRTFFSGSPAAVKGIDLHRATGFLQLRRPDSNGWLLQQPVTGYANPQPLIEWIETVFSGRIVGFVTDEKTDLTAYGLETPDTELALYQQNGDVQTLLVGRAPADNPDVRYAKRVEQDTVFTVPAEWAAKLEVNPSDLRSRRLLHITPPQIQAVTISRGENTVELTKTNSTWQVMRPARWTAHKKQIQNLLTRWSEASVEQFLDAPTEEQLAQIDTAPWNITFNTEDGPVSLQITEPGTNGLRLVRGTPNIPLCRVSGDLIHSDLVDPLHYRSPVVMEINPAQIEKLTRTVGETEQTVQKSEDGSFSTVDTGRSLKAGALTDIMWELNNLTVKRYTAYNPETLTPYGLDRPHARLTVTLSETNALGRILLLGAESETGRFAMVQGRPVVFELPPETVEILLQDLTQPAASP